MPLRDRKLVKTTSPQQSTVKVRKGYNQPPTTKKRRSIRTPNPNARPRRRWLKTLLRRSNPLPLKRKSEVFNLSHTKAANIPAPPTTLATCTSNSQAAQKISNPCPVLTRKLLLPTNPSSRTTPSSRSLRLSPTWLIVNPT